MTIEIIEREVANLESYICTTLNHYWNFSEGVTAYVQGVGDRSESLIEALDLADRTFPSPKEASQRKKLRDAINQYRRDYGLVMLAVLR